MVMNLLNPMVDDAMIKMMTEDYPDNPFLMVTIMEKLTPRALFEAGMRAESGKELKRPFGSPVVLSPWEKILLSPRQLFSLPTSTIMDIDTKTVIGPNCKKPLNLDIPIMITGMSYGGSLSLQIKTALAKGAALAGTSTNTGESAVTDEERNAAKYLIGQYHRGGWLNTREQLEKVDAIEIQLGQGAWGGAVESSTQAKDIGEHLQKAWHLTDGENASIYSRMPNINTPEDIIELVNTIKSQYDVPVGIKIAGSDYIEYELEVIAQTNADFITIDGSEGGTAVAPPTLEDDLGLPTLHTLARTINWLEENNIRKNFSVIAAGGLKTPGDFLKALAIGADAVYIGTIAVVAALQQQMTKSLPLAPASQLAMYDGKLNDQIDIDMAAQSLANFLKSCVAEMKLALQACGKSAIAELSKEDLVTVDREIAQMLGIRYGMEARRDKYSPVEHPTERYHEKYVN